MCIKRAGNSPRTTYCAAMTEGKSNDMQNTKKIKLLSELFCDGIAFIEKHPKMAAAFGMAPDKWRVLDERERVERFIKALPQRSLVNPDYFYAAMHAGLANNFDSGSEAISKVFRHLEGAKYPEALFNETYARFELDSALNDAFIAEGNGFSSLTDDELKSAVQNQFAISYRSLLLTPHDESFVFTKINHGYWEHFLAVYASSYAHRANVEEYRQLNGQQYAMRYSYSGFDRALAYVLRQTADAQIAAIGSQGIAARLSISFCAGERPCAFLLKRPLNPIPRAAIAGALTFFKSITKRAPINLGDGAEAKGLFDNRETNLFVEKYVGDADAVLFVVPPHLRDITIRGMNSSVYKLLIPGHFAHETWRTSLPVFHAVMQKILAKHKRVTVLTQSAVLAPVLGLSMQDIRSYSGHDSLVRFFDLGRVLDVAAPEVVAKQHWFKQYANIPRHELSPFELSGQSSSSSIISGDNNWEGI